MGTFLTEQQISSFRKDGFLVVPDFVPAERCLALREHAMRLAKKHVPSPEQATIFTADGQPQHASDDYFLSSGEQIRCFFEKDAFDEKGRLRNEAHLSLNKLGHAMHDLDPVFDSFSRTPELAAVAHDIGMIDPLLLQSMYIFKQAHIGGEVTCHTDTRTCGPNRAAWSGSGLQSTTRLARTAVCGRCLAGIGCLFEADHG